MNVASVAVPTVAHAPVSTSGLAEKISIRNLDFYYGASKALKGISLPLYQNKVTAFVGPSGCGKSTLLRVLNRMYDLYPNQRAEGDLRGQALRKAVALGTGWAGRDLAAPRRPLGGSQGQARRQWAEPLRRPAAAAVHRAHRGG